MVSDEQIEFIKANFPNRYSHAELMGILNLSYNQIKRVIEKNHLRKRGRSTVWCKDKLQFLYEHKDMKNKPLYELFLKEFGVYVSYGAFLRNGMTKMKYTLINKQDDIRNS